MKRIARQVGVTQPVVSAVLNNRSYCRVSAEKREAILALAKELGFRPNTAARHLRGKKTNTIAIFTNQGCSVLQNEILRIMLRILEERHLHAYTVTAGDPGELREKLLEMKALGIDAFIGFYLGFELNLSEDWPLPAVSLGVSWRNPDVAADDFQGGELLCKHLLDHGLRRFAFLCNTVEKNIDKYSAIEQMIRNSNIPGVTLKAMEFHHNPEIVNEILSAVKNKKVQAFMASNDYIAGRLMGLLQHSGIAVPGDVAITGFDGLAASTMTPVPLTTVVLPLRQLAERTVELLLTRMEGKKDERKFLLPVTLRIGESCGCSVPFDFGFYWERIPPVLENTEDNENINDTISLSEQITERKK